MNIQNFKVTNDIVYVNGVPYYRESVDLAKAKKVVEKWEWINDFIISEVFAAQSLYDDMKNKDLVFNTIETEGYLRAIKIVKQQLEYINESVDNE